MMYGIVYNLVDIPANTPSTAPLFEPEAIHYDFWYHNIYFSRCILILSVIYGMLVVFSWYSGFLHQ
jgi:hypothetical protein